MWLPVALRSCAASCVLMLLGAGAAHAQVPDPQPTPGVAPPAADASGPAPSEPPLDFHPLFNGLNLAGWSVVNGAPSTWTVKDGQLVSSGKPTGVLRSDRMYENFVLELDWQHVHPEGNSGLFVWSDPLPAPGVPFTRAFEVQIMDGTETPDYTSDGDIFSIWGAHFTPDRPHPNGWERCLPNEKRVKPSPEWNHYRVTCRDGTIKLEVNGAEVSGGHDAAPRKGYICLESEGSEVRFRDVRLAELPPANPPLPATQVAAEQRGLRSLYDGVSLLGWHAGEAHGEIGGHWEPRDWTLWTDGTGGTLASDWVGRDFELQLDWRWLGTPKDPRVPAHLRLDWPEDDGAYTDPGAWNRARFEFHGHKVTLEINGRTVLQDADCPIGAGAGTVVLQASGVPTEFANIFVRNL
jgi:hypothetical protein